MPTAYVLIQREERKSVCQELWTTKLSDHADFFIILQSMSASTDRAKKLGRFCVQIQRLEGKHGPGEPHPRGVLEPRAKSTWEKVILPIAFFLRKG